MIYANSLRNFTEKLFFENEFKQLVGMKLKKIGFRVWVWVLMDLWVWILCLKPVFYGFMGMSLGFEPT
jgi:hypothetical protein